MQENQERNPLPYDLIILGASGFTGKYVVKEALRFLDHPPLKTLALAGRNPTKLTQTLRWASHPNPPPRTPVLTFNTSDPQSLLSLCQQTKLVLNCVGPFRHYGEPVVAACVETGCDYLDICGEPEFMERMEAKYGEKAAETGSLIISACGFDSVPAELGLLFNSRQWVEPAVPNRVEAYLSLESEKRMAGNFGTYESAVLGVANSESLQELRRSRPRRARPVIPGPTPPKGPLIEHQKKIGVWAVKLPSADSIVVRRTLASLTENPGGLPGVNESVEQIEKREAFWSTVKPAYFGVKIGSKSVLGVLRFIIVGVIMGLLGKTAVGRWLLLKFPSIFSLGWFRKKGPSDDEVRSASFKMWFIGHGFSNGSLASQGNRKPDMEIITRVMGPEIGYLTTPIILLQCALILLSQRENLPRGGVLTPGIVFGPTDLQERLQENGISFDVISKTALSPLKHFSKKDEITRTSGLRIVCCKVPSRSYASSAEGAAISIEATGFTDQLLSTNANLETPDEGLLNDTVEHLLANPDDVARLMKMERRSINLDGGQSVRANRWFPYLDRFRCGTDEYLSSGEVLEALSPYISDVRKERFRNVVRNRSYSVCLVVEGLCDFGNVSAVFRSADALGFQSVHVVSCDSKRYRNNRHVSMGAEKWLDIELWNSTVECFNFLRSRGYRIATTHVGMDAVSIYEMDWSCPTAIVVGNENRGISEEALELSDLHCSIPMKGMVDSFNVSVAAGILMHHAVCDRTSRLGFHGDLTMEQSQILLAEFSLRHSRSAISIADEYAKRKAGMFTPKL